MIRNLRFQYSKRALRDLAGIYNYIFEDNPEAARRLVASLESKVIALASSGNTGVPRDRLSPGLRAFPYRDRCIYFRVSDGEMRIIRILHEKQEVSPELFAQGDCD